MKVLVSLILVLLLKPVQPQPRISDWKVTEIFDQGQSKSCFLYAWKEYLDQYPNSPDFCTLSDWRKNYPDFGQKLVDEGLISRYIGTDNQELIREHLRTVGPIIFTMPLYDSMEPSPDDGVLKVVESKTKTGHAVLLYADRTEGVIGLNSWGDDWGDCGSFIILNSDLTFLLSHGAYAWIPFK